MIVAIEDERNECGTRSDNFQAELTSQVVTEGCGTHFGDGETAGGNDEVGSTEFAIGAGDDEFVGMRDLGSTRIREDLNAGFAAFGFEKIDYFRGGIVAEKLP